MAKAEYAPTWTDCECGWRSHRELVTENPVAVSSTASASWAFPERCGNCGAELEPERAEAA